MIKGDRLTRHERRTLIAALEREVNYRARLAKAAKTDRTRSMADADAYVASDLLRQLSTQ